MIYDNQDENFGRSTKPEALNKFFFAILWSFTLVMTFLRLFGLIFGIFAKRVLAIDSLDDK